MARFEIVVCTNHEVLGVENDENSPLTLQESISAAWREFERRVEAELGLPILLRVTCSDSFRMWRGGIYSRRPNNCSNVWISIDSPRAMELAEQVASIWHDCLAECVEV